MAGNIDTAMDLLRPVGYWAAYTGAVLGAVATYAALTQTGAKSDGGQFFDGTGGGGASSLATGGTGYLVSDTTTGNAISTLINGSGTTLRCSFTTAAALPSAKTLISCKNNSGYGVEVFFGGSGIGNNGAATPNITVYMNTSGAVSRTMIFTLTGDASTYSHFADGKKHDLEVWVIKTPITGTTVCRVWLDGVEIFTSYDTGSVTFNAFPTDTTVLAFGANVVNGSATRNFTGTIQAPAVFSGQLDKRGRIDLMGACWNMRGQIPRSARFDCQTATFYSSTDTSVVANVGDQVRRAVSADGLLTFTQATTARAPYLRVDEKGKKYLQFINRFQRRDFSSEGLSNVQMWMDATISCQQGYHGMYFVGSLNTVAQFGGVSCIAFWHDGAGSRYFGMQAGSGGSEYRLCGRVVNTIRTPTSTDFKTVNCTPGIGVCGLSVGYFGIDSLNLGTAAVYNDGVVSALSSQLADNATEKLTATTLRIGVFNTTDLTSANTTCDGFDGRLYVIEVSTARPITDIEFRRSEAADRAALGLTAGYIANALGVGDSTFSGQNDYTGDGTMARTRGLRNCKVTNASYPNIKHSNYASTFDLSQQHYHMPLPTLIIDALGINDINGGDSFGTQQYYCTTIIDNARGVNGGSAYCIARLCPLSAAVNGGAGNPTFDAWVVSGASPFVATYRGAKADASATPKTSYQDNIHPNELGTANDAMGLSPLVEAGLRALGATVNVGDTARDLMRIG